MPPPPTDDPLDASLQDFEPSPRTPFGYPSAHSGFRSSDAGTTSDANDSAPEDEDLPLEEEEEEEEDVSAGGYSPPAWRRLGNGDRSSGFWRTGGDAKGGGGGGGGGGGFGGFDLGGGHLSRDLSPVSDGEEEEVLEQAIRTRLPTGSLSPEKERSPEPELGGVRVKQEGGEEDTKATLVGLKEVSENYIRFAVRAEVQQRTEPIEAAIGFLRGTLGRMTRSWTSLALSTLMAILAYSVMRTLFGPAAQRPVPDLVKVAGIARSFEPLIHYSENGVQQVGDLQATGVAVWDLGESLRTSNMTSAPIIVKELDELSDSLRTLAIELTKFFANVDGDIDGILIVMDWARRELSQLQQSPPAALSSAFDNIHNLLSSAGILEDSATGEPTRAGQVTISLFGMSNPQRARQTLQRTFNEFLSVLEEAIASELQHSLSLFGLFEAIDRQFLNLARTVARESSLQEDEHADLLSSLWTRLLGPKASEVAKYERNRRLLQNVREKTVRNKGILVEHNHRLLALKASLENLRRKLVSPLVRSVNSSHLTVEEQIRGLEDAGVYLEAVRARQKGRLMELLYGRGSGSANRVGEARSRSAIDDGVAAGGGYGVEVGAGSGS